MSNIEKYCSAHAALMDCNLKMFALGILFLLEPARIAGTARRGMAKVFMLLLIKLF